MLVNRPYHTDRVGQNDTVGHFNLERVNNFNYIGVIITAHNNIIEEIKGIL